MVRGARPSRRARDAHRRGAAWEVFWREHGDRFDWVRFTDERTACWYLLGRLAHSQLLRGALAVRAPFVETEDPAGGGS